MSRTRHHGDKAKARTYGRSWWWMRNYPKWWDHLRHTIPRRQAERQTVHRTLRDPDHGENEVWPLDHKPHQYYW